MSAGDRSASCFRCSCSRISCTRSSAESGSRWRGQGITQILFYCVVARRARLPARHVHGARLLGDRVRSPLRPAARRGRLLPRASRRREEGAGLEELRHDGARLQRPLLGAALRDPARAGTPVPEPGSHEGRAGAPLAEHRRQLHHEHELAVLRRRVHDVATSPRWPASRCRTSSPPRSAWRCSWRSSAGSRAARPSTLGNFWVDLYRSLVYILLPLAVIVTVLLVWQGVPQTLARPCDRAHAAGRDADDRARPGRLPDRDQAAGDERRRLLQLELRPSPSRTRPGSRTSSRCWRSC